MNILIYILGCLREAYINLSCLHGITYFTLLYHLCKLYVMFLSKTKTITLQQTQRIPFLSWVYLNFSPMAGQVWRVAGLQVSAGDELGLGTAPLQPPTAGLGTLRQGAGHQHQVRPPTTKIFLTLRRTGPLNLWSVTWVTDSVSEWVSDHKKDHTNHFYTTLVFL